MVVGDRQVETIEHFSPLKKGLQRLGSWVVRQASSTDVPDTTSGFRAYNREAAIQMKVVSRFTYTLETIIQAGKLLVAIDHVPIRTNPKTRESRLFPSMWAYVRRNALSIFRIYAQYEPLKVFWGAALVMGTAAAIIWGRFFYFYVHGHGQGPRAVADPRRGALHRGDAARGARRDRRPARRPAADQPAHHGARAAHRARSSASRPRTTSRARRDTGRTATTGAGAADATGGNTEEREALQLEHR